jgi:hypothetical protein
VNLHGINNLRQTEKLAAEPTLPKYVSIDILAPFDIGSLIYIKGRHFKKIRVVKIIFLVNLKMGTRYP